MKQKKKHRSLPTHEKAKRPWSLKLLGGNFLPAERNFSLHFSGTQGSWLGQDNPLKLSLEQSPGMLDRVQIRGVGRTGLERNSVTFGKGRHDLRSVDCWESGFRRAARTSSRTGSRQRRSSSGDTRAKIEPFIRAATDLAASHRSNSTPPTSPDDTLQD